MQIGIDPTIDFACQRVLGDPEQTASVDQHESKTTTFPGQAMRFT